MKQVIKIRNGMIRLGQLLKLAGVVDTGGEAKQVIQSGEVKVNGQVETKRGRQLVTGDEVQVGGQLLIVQDGEHLP